MLNMYFNFFDHGKAHSCMRLHRLSHRAQKSAERSNGLTCRWISEKSIHEWKFCVYFSYLWRSLPRTDVHEISHDGSRRPCDQFASGGL